MAVQDGKRRGHFNARALAAIEAKTAARQSAAGQPASFTWEQTEYTLGSARVANDGMILVAIPLPKGSPRP